MKKLLQAILASLVTFTRIPVPGYLAAESFENATWHIPLIAWLNVGILALVWRYLEGPFDLKIFLVILLPIVVSGAMHEDGLADCMDGLYGGRDQETRLLIMKDPRVGSFGVVSLGLYGLGHYLALKNLPPFAVVSTFALVMPLSRLAGPVLAAVLPYVRSGKDSNKAGSYLSAGVWKLCWSILWVLPVIYFVPSLSFGLDLVGTLLVCLFCCGMIFRAKLSGITGDCLGAAIKISELVLLWFVVLHVRP